MRYSMLMGNVVKSLADDESRDWFEARMKYSMTHNPFDFYPCIYKYCDKFIGWDLTALSRPEYADKKIILFGAGNYGKHSYEILKRSDLRNNIYAFVDNDLEKQHSKICGLPVMSLLDLDDDEKGGVFIICSLDGGKDIHHLLTRYGVSQTNIFFPPYGRLTAGMGKQYFDLFHADSKEVFVDAGCYDGQTTVDFSKWCKNDYERIYAFEPSKKLNYICKDKFSQNGIKGYELIEKVCWSKKETVHFSHDAASEVFGGACVQESVGRGVETDSIDNVLNGDRVTFIKMDIEGSELEALHGAKDSIRKWHPKLAISLYHKYEDILEIPSYILNLVEDYRLYIRHYSSDVWETVLYAI